MNKTIVGFVVAGILMAGLGLGLLFQQKQNRQLARKISELENQIRAQTDTGAARNAFLESIHGEVSQLSQAQAQLRAEHESIAAVVTAESAARKVPQAEMLRGTNSASILARLPYLTAEAYRLAAAGVGPIQPLSPPMKPVPALNYQQYLRLSDVQRTQWSVEYRNYQTWLAGRTERIHANAQFLLENKLREMGADNQTIESVRLANKRLDEALTQMDASDTQQRAAQTAASAQEQMASAIRGQAAAQAATAQELRMQRLIPPPTPLQLEPTKVRIVP